MEIIIIGTVEDVSPYNGKSGYGCNIKISQLKDKKRKELTFITKSPIIAEKLDLKLQEEVTLKIVLEQNNFGLRFADVLEVA